MRRGWGQGLGAWMERSGRTQPGLLELTVEASIDRPRKGLDPKGSLRPLPSSKPSASPKRVGMPSPRNGRRA